MEDSEKKAKQIKLIILIFIIIFTSIIGILLYKNVTKINKLKERLEKENYKAEYKNLYYKKTKNENTKTNYSFDINQNQLTKSIRENSQSLNKNIIITYKNNIIKLTYTYLDTNGCKINQKATYDKKFKCQIKYINKQECTSKCDEILNEIKIFEKEYKKITNNL